MAFETSSVTASCDFVDDHKFPDTANEIEALEEKLKNPLNNLRVIKEYRDTSKNEIHWRDRFWQVR